MTELTARLTLKSGEEKLFHESPIIAHDMHSLADAVTRMQKQINNELTQIIEVENSTAAVPVNGNKTNDDDEEDSDDDKEEEEENKELDAEHREPADKKIRLQSNEHPGL